MNIKGDLLKVTSGALNIKGEKLEPEEQLARREVILDAPVQVGAGAAGKHAGSIPTSIISDQTVGELTRALKSMCGNCKHFNVKDWLRDLARADAQDAPIEKRRAVNKIRAALLQTQNVQVADAHSGQDGDFDVEHALRTLGYCRALFAANKAKGESNADAVVLVHPMSRCPQDVQDAIPPVGFFEWKDAESKAAATTAYDELMRRAQGKTK